MQFCPSYQIVQHLRTGASPQEACERVITDMLLQTNKWFEVGLIALDTKVNYVHVAHVKHLFCCSLPLFYNRSSFCRETQVLLEL